MNFLDGEGRGYRKPGNGEASGTRRAVAGGGRREAAGEAARRSK